jgi:acetylornithine deacetylase/succinyl-diaminopimelate desuccinylase-like protein
MNREPNGPTRDAQTIREALAKRLNSSRDQLVRLCSEFGRVDSSNPPGDTTAMVEACRRMLDGVAGVAVEEIARERPKVNLIARLSGGAPGPRLVMNGHLDNPPVFYPERWTVAPFGGVVAAGRIYGRGISDMKAGVAAQVLAMRELAAFQEHLAGDLILMLVADEGTGGRAGTQYVLEKRPELAGDAMMSADAGSPLVARIGEKGFLWIEIEAQGKPAASAHPHLGVNAIERLLPALHAIAKVAEGTMPIPPAIGAAIEKASPRSEASTGMGETHTLTHITVNIGMVQGGTRINTLPGQASAKVDIRMPPGTTIADMRSRIANVLDGIPDVAWRILDAAEPNWTEPEEAIVAALARNAAAVLGQPVGCSIRAGFSDSRFFRQRGVPTVVYGVMPYNNNAPDEHVLIGDLEAVFKVHALTAFDYLTAGG